tara:strand:+ start:188 stop:673 length:486 start_codon:yes stop_codon:yes gene_type:complete
MATRIGKYKVSKKESALSLVDGGTPVGGLFKANSSPTGTSTVLTNDDSGKVIFMDASSANTITLPAVSTVSAGWNVKVILTATGAAGIINTNGGEDKITGFVEEVALNGNNHTVTVDADADKITFVDTCNPGSFVNIISNGSLFFVEGFGTPADKLTLTKD